MTSDKQMRHNYRVRPIILQDRTGRFYQTYFLAEIIGPFVCDPTGWAVIGRTVPGSVSKLANLVRKRGKGTLLDQQDRHSWNAGIIGLNRGR
jgi:hypothetical protein